MGKVNCTGEGFKLIGHILTNEGVTRYLEERGQELVTTFLEQTTAKWLYSHARATSSARSQLLRSVNSSETLPKSVGNNLNKLPNLIIGRSLDVLARNTPSLVSGNYREKLVAVPRVLVRFDYISALIDDLGQSAELIRFKALQESFLRDQVKSAEEVFLSEFKQLGDRWLLTTKAFLLLLSILTGDSRKLRAITIAACPTPTPPAYRNGATARSS